MVSVYSLLAHKEFRFIFPVLPVMHACSGIAMAAAEGRGKLALGLLLAVVLAVNVPMAAYFATIHQQGTLAAVLFLREQFEAEVSHLFLFSHLTESRPNRALERPSPFLGSVQALLSKALALL